MVDISDDGVWDAKDVGRYLKLSRSSVYDLSDKGVIPCHYLGSRRRYVPAEIRALLTSPRFAPGSRPAARGPRPAASTTDGDTEH